MNVFLIPLQERISLSLLHPSSPSLSLIILISIIFFYLHLSLISYLWHFLFSISKFRTKSIFQYVAFGCHVDNYFSWVSAWIFIMILTMSITFLISFCIYILIYWYVIQAWVFYLMLFLLIYMTFRMFLYHSTSFSLYLIYFLSDVSRFSSLSPSVPRRDWQWKGKEHEKYFWLRAFTNV